MDKHSVEFANKLKYYYIVNDSVKVLEIHHFLEEF